MLRPDIVRGRAAASMSALQKRQARLIGKDRTRGRRTIARGGRTG